MSTLTEVHVAPRPVDRFLPLLGDLPIGEARAAAAELIRRAQHRTVWNLNSTAVGGGVAEMLRSLLSFARGLGIDARWLVLRGSPEFFRITKRVHNALHGDVGDGSPLGAEERRVYEHVLAASAQDLLAMVRRDDVVLLHDPQTLGIAPHLLSSGAKVVWRCHIGADAPNEQTAVGWSFLAPYLRHVQLCVFSRPVYAPPEVDRARSVVIQPSIDPFSPKNQDMREVNVQSILADVGLVIAPTDHSNSIFTREDGTPGRVDHAADTLRLGPPPEWTTPIVAQVSRWDRLKDPVGVLRGFASFVRAGDSRGLNLLLAGPNVNAVADDPDGATVFQEVVAAWRTLPHHIRRLIHLANLPTADVEENGAIVNAIQRHATIVVQKSLREGFGLTVTEAMWKARPVIGSAVGGIQDQIEDGISGVLLRDPADLDAFAAAIRRLLYDAPAAAAMGERAQARVRDRFLGLRHLVDYARVIDRLDREQRPMAA